MADKEPTIVTFNEDEAHTILDVLQVTTCAACGEPLTAQTLGGALADTRGAAAFHNRLPCFEACLKRQGTDNR